MQKVLFISLVYFFRIFLTIPSNADKVKIIDSHHYSTVFGEVRNFRIYLPSDYDESSRKRYPVIYYFHGWSQRYFDIASGDSHDKEDNITRYVSNNDVIVVKWDGFNIREGDECYLRPYNISPVETYRQFPMYFPELVRYIDSQYRTIPDREHRAVSGLSISGFMTFWIGGKYPDLVCAAGNFCGSPEFRTGPKAFPVEYRHIDMYKNYDGMRIRLNFGDNDFIRAYHYDMNRIFPQIMDNYEFGIYEAAHTTCGLGEMFDFIMNTFENPPKKPAKWHHIDVYPDFSLWGYTVSSNRMVPGFTILENVNKRGFRSSVREFLPDGEIMPFVKVSVITAPIYEKDKEYLVNDINHLKHDSRQFTARSDNEGKLKFILDGYIHDIGINEKGDTPNLSVASFTVENMNWAAPLKNVEISLQILNKGGTRANRVSAELQATRDNATIIKDTTDYGNIPVNEVKKSNSCFTFYAKADSIEVEKFTVVMKDSDNRQWTDSIEVPIKVDYPELTDVKIADGLEHTVAVAGTTHTSIFMGAGNGDGTANPGESIVILVKDAHDTVYRRNLLYTSDSYVNPNGINRRISDSWGRFDHVGGSNKVSVPVISSDCPNNHVIEFFAEYWLPKYPDHIIKRGKVKIRVTGKDTTPPQIEWVRVTGNNVIQVKVFDGGKVENVTAKLKFKQTRFFDYPHEDFEVSLNDEGIDGDAIQGDTVSSVKISEQKFGLFTVEIEADDKFGNKSMKVFSDVFTIH